MVIPARLITTENALRLVELAGRTDIPVARGAEKTFTASNWWGWLASARAERGWEKLIFLPLKLNPTGRRAAQFIVDTVMHNPGEITLVSLGPLTNLALAVSLETPHL